MKPSAILMSVPTRGSIQWATVTRLEEIHAQYRDMSPILYQPGHVSVAETRNLIRERFLDGPWGALLMVDDDVVPSPQFLAEAARRINECHMIGLPAPVLDPQDPTSLRFNIYQEMAGGFEFTDPEPGLNECDAIGLGCTLIHRRVLEETGTFVLEYGRGEDLTFCDRATSLGFKVGYWWDGHYADHLARLSLAPLAMRSVLA